MSARLRAAMALLLTCALFFPFASSAFINFQNCLSPTITDSSPEQLQFTPYFFDVTFDRQPPYNLDVTIYGNVSGKQFVGKYPPPNSPHWSDPGATLGKIPATGDNNINTTLFANFKVLQYTAYDAKPSFFCPHLVNGSSCPVGPAFYKNASDPYDLPAFSLSHGFGSPYEFSTLTPTITVISGDVNSPTLACISANITPYLGYAVVTLITWLPAAILIVKGLATLTAAIWSPWGSSDIFRWSSNYGRDEDLLRLVTPGFGDCLQYIQFFALMGSLTLSFPGFFQPAVSQMSWSLLLFNNSFVSHGNGTQSVVDGIYATNGTYGLETMQELIGMTTPQDVWASMAVWLLVIAVAVILLCQIGFFFRWIYRAVTKTSEQDLRRKNLPFTLGNMIRLLFNYFILPIVALSLFQLVISPSSLAVTVAFAAVLLVLLIVSAGWILHVIFTAKPRTYLFDDMPTVLLYGPLYNTYSDSAAPFALVPVIITFMRGVAFGAVQPSGTGQIVILAVCEVILILTLNAFRPFQNQTSMNAYHTFFAVVRLITVLLCIAFIPSLGVTEAPKGWVGYAILLLHACVLVFGFFLNAIQTLIEVTARSLGLAGREAQTGVMRGSILSWRMLKKRKARPSTAGGPDHRTSMASNAAMLRTSHGDEARSWTAGRSRSISASSQQLLNQGVVNNAGMGTTVNRMSGVDHFGNPEDTSTEPDSAGNGGLGGFAFISGGAAAGAAAGAGLAKSDLVKGEETFYRPPRPRKNTSEPLSAGAKSRSAGSAADFPYTDSPTHQAAAAAAAAKRGSAGSPAPAYLRDRADSDGEIPQTDYAVREVDQYYHRGPALSDQPTRKLKTGPADPQGPAASAQSWLQRLMFGVKSNKKKEEGKGFEVVRSARQPPNMQQMQGGGNGDEEAVEMQTSPPMTQEPYRDLPDDQQQQLKHHQRDNSARFSGRPISPLTEEERQAHIKLVNYGSDDEDAGGRPRVSNISKISESETRGIRPDSDTIGQNQIAAAGAVGALGGAVAANQLAQPRRSGDTQHSSRYDRSRAISETGDGGHPDYRLSSNLPPLLDPIELGGGLDLPSRFNSRRTGRLVDDEGESSNAAYLRDVDNLTWQHSNINTSYTNSNSAAGPSSSAAAAGGGTATLSPGQQHYTTTRLAPGIPRRSSRRDSSANNTSAGHTPSGSMGGSYRPPLPGDANMVQGGAVENFNFNNFDFDSTTPTPAGYVAGTNASSTSRVGGGVAPHFRGHHQQQASTSSYFLDANDDDENENEAVDDDAAEPDTSSRGVNASRHRAADSITRNSFGANAALHASSAEVVEDSGPSPPPPAATPAMTTATTTATNSAHIPPPLEPTLPTQTIGKDGVRRESSGWGHVSRFSGL